RQTTAFYADYAGSAGAIPDLGDPALRQYTQSYDTVGNLLEMKHQVGDGGAVAWRRGYAYEVGNNQLVSTSAPGDDSDDPSTHTDRYQYNDRGAMTAMPHLPALVRDHQDQIRRADLDLAGSVAWYAYDAGGQRVRKRVDKGGVQEERIYVGGYEVWRKRTSSGLQEERQTLHVMDDQRRVAMAETLSVTNGSAVANPIPRQRYQLDDHVGTATLEVDESGAVITYEEYHPHGTTAWYAEKAGTQVSAKRYRYTGNEKDEETGLNYHDARYYAPWLGRWERPDPAGLSDGPNRFAHVRGNPVRLADPSGLAGEEQLLNQAARAAGSTRVQAAFRAATASAERLGLQGALRTGTTLGAAPEVAATGGALAWGGVVTVGVAGGFGGYAGLVALDNRIELPVGEGYFSNSVHGYQAFADYASEHGVSEALRVAVGISPLSASKSPDYEDLLDVIEVKTEDEFEEETDDHARYLFRASPRGTSRPCSRGEASGRWVQIRRWRP
ncbi:MAG: RHS repeat-associated core domain-containing protein, partial [Myxococcota bacterium]